MNASIEKMKIVYIAHPISGDVLGNLNKIITIIKRLNKYPNIVPFAHYYVDCTALDDTDPVQRAKGIANDMAIINRLPFDACLLFGDKVSSGMLNEVGEFNRRGIQVIPMTTATMQALTRLELLYVDPFDAWRKLIHPNKDNGLYNAETDGTRVCGNTGLPRSITDKITRDINKLENRKNNR